MGESYRDWSGVPTPDARLARIETLISEIRSDLRDYRDESSRTRTRLHKVEGLTNVMAAEQEQRRKGEAQRARRLELRLMLLSVVVAMAAIVVPVVLTVALR